MDRISKELKKFTETEREKVRKVLTQLDAGFFKGLDIKKLRGHDDIFRVRKGEIRIIYKKTELHEVLILTIERRSDTTYHNF